MFSCKVVYNVDTETLESDTPITIGSIRKNETLKDCLGYGDNVNIMINGVAQSNEAVVPHDAVVVIETAANKKNAFKEVFQSVHELLDYIRGLMKPTRA